jgi:hypothetical protein
MVNSMDETLLRGFHSVMKLRPFISATFHRVKNELHSVKSIASHCEVEDDLCTQKGLSLRFVDTVQFPNAYKTVLLITYQTLVGMFSRGGLSLWIRQVSTLLPIRQGIPWRKFQRANHGIGPFIATYGTVPTGDGTNGLRR